MHLPRMLPTRGTLALAFALDTVWRARRRMLLAVLGAAIGFGTIDVMLIIGSSAQASVRATLASLGGDVATLTFSMQRPAGLHAVPWGAEPLSTATDEPWEEGPPLDLPSAGRLIASMPGVEAAAWARRLNGCSGSDPSPDVVAVAPRVQQLLSLRLALGRALTEVDQEQPTIVLGAAAAVALRARHPGLAVGSLLALCGRQLQVVGILKAHPGSEVLQGLRINDSVLLAMSERELLETPAEKLLLLRLRASPDAQALARQLQALARRLVPGHTVQAQGAWEFLKARQEQVSLYVRFFAVMGGVALLVGILGIANMMLAAVSERRHEIGLRMTVGARRSDIVAQFLLEGVLVCAAGAALGMAAALPVGWLALGAVGLPMVLSLEVVALATVLALVCGTAAGIAPARRAAGTDPIQGLQAGG
jgi:putative ABC transport system permease protein